MCHRANHQVPDIQGNSERTPLPTADPGANCVNEQRAADEIGETIVRPEADFVRTTTGFAIGGVPPFGHAQQIVPFLDSDLLHIGTVWAAAGTPNAVFSVAPARLRDALDARVMRMS